MRSRYLLQLGCTNRVKLKSEKVHDEIRSTVDPAGDRVDIAKLRRLCSRFGLPENKWRARTWQLLLGCLPRSVSQWDDAAAEMREDLSDVQRTLGVLTASAALADPRQADEDDEEEEEEEEEDGRSSEEKGKGTMAAAGDDLPLNLAAAAAAVGEAQQAAAICKLLRAHRSEIDGLPPLPLALDAASALSVACALVAACNVATSVRHADDCEAYWCAYAYARVFDDDAEAAKARRGSAALAGSSGGGGRLSSAPLRLRNESEVLAALIKRQLLQLRNN